MAAVQRYTAGSPCPICGGHPGLNQGHQERCHGYLSGDRSHALCSREEFGGEPSPGRPNLYRHWLEGPCDCGTDHRDQVESVGPGINGSAPPRPRRPRQLIYDYTAAGDLLFQVVRTEAADGSKKITQRRPAPDHPGTFIYSLKDLPRPFPLYNAEGIRELAPGETLVIVEGEKHAQRLIDLGIAATTSVMGAGAARHSDWSPVHSLDVVLVPDNDPPGHGHMHDIAERCRAEGAASVRWLELPGLAEKGDVLDWLAAGGTAEELRKLIAEASTPANKANKANKGGSVGGSNGDLSSHSSHSSQGATLPEHDEPVVIREWPAAPGLDLWHGPAADFTLAVAPHTEADPIGVLASVLATIGSMVGRGPHWNVGATTHYLNLFVCTVGRTSAGRKGTAKDLALWAAEQVDPVWGASCVKGGLSSGEGLIWAVRDPIVKRMPVKERGRVVDYQDETVDQGVEDKRLLVVETEFGGTLKVMAREGNTLSSTLRQAWDTGNLGILTKNNPAVATGAHVSIVAHSTEHDVDRYLGTTEAGNGFGNRFLWLAVRRSKYLPSGSPIPEDIAAAVIKPLAEAVAYGRGIGWALSRDAAADELWDHLYRTELDINAPGLLGAILGRAEAQTMRLACLFAILDRTTVIGLAHLRAALELWRYCVRSAGFIFGDQLGDRDAELALSAIQSSPEGLSQSQLSIDVFQKNKSKRDIARILGRLLEGGLIRSEMIPTGGRPAKLWFSTRVTKVTKETKETPTGAAYEGS